MSWPREYSDEILIEEFSVATNELDNPADMGTTATATAYSLDLATLTDYSWYEYEWATSADWRNWYGGMQEVEQAPPPPASSQRDSKHTSRTRRPPWQNWQGIALFVQEAVVNAKHIMATGVQNAKPDRVSNVIQKAYQFDTFVSAVVKLMREEAKALHKENQRLVKEVERLRAERRTVHFQ